MAERVEPVRGAAPAWLWFAWFGVGAVAAALISGALLGTRRTAA